MAKGSFSITHTKTSRKFTYSGDLSAAISKAEKELREKENNLTKRDFLFWTYQRAKKELEAWDRRLDDLRAFIRAAKDELRKQQEGGDERDQE